MEVLYQGKGKPCRIRGLKYADRVRSSSFSGPHHEDRTQHKVNLKEVCSIVAPMSMPRSNDLWSSNRTTAEDIHIACMYPTTWLSKTILKLARPISTNSGRGAAKKGLRQEEHTIVYTSAEAPSKLLNETHMHKNPIKIDLINPSEKLDPLSRINLGKCYPIEHNVPVCEVGEITGSHKRVLLQYYNTEMERMVHS